MSWALPSSSHVRCFAEWIPPSQHDSSSSWHENSILHDSSMKAIDLFFHGVSRSGLHPASMASLRAAGSSVSRAARSSTRMRARIGLLELLARKLHFRAK